MEGTDKLYRDMIVRLSEEVAPEELDKMKFFCKEIIPGGQRDKIKSFLNLIEKLEERKKVGHQNLNFFKTMIGSCTSGREDVFDVIAAYEKNSGEAMDAVPVDNNRATLVEPIEFLRNRLGRDWRWFVRALGVEDTDIDNLESAYPRDVKEQVRRAIKIYMNSRREQSCVQDFIAACKRVKRMDLARKLEAGDYT